MKKTLFLGLGILLVLLIYFYFSKQSDQDIKKLAATYYDEARFLYLYLSKEPFTGKTILFPSEEISSPSKKITSGGLKILENGQIIMALYHKGWCATVLDDQQKITFHKTKKQLCTLKEQQLTAQTVLPSTDFDYYQGKNPNNWVELDHQLWRILSKKDGQMKLVKDESLGPIQWNEGIRKTDWATSTLFHYLNETWYSSLKESVQALIKEEEWQIGSVTWQKLEDSTVSLEESAKVVTAKVGLMSVTDIMHGSKKGCTLKDEHQPDCSGENWILKEECEWLINNVEIDPYVWQITPYKDFNVYFPDQEPYMLRPVIYLKKETTFVGGDGTYKNPYVIES